MTTQLARLHSHPSNRAKVRSALARKPVFKSVLENPFQISWCVPFQSYGNTRPTIPRPSVPVNVQNVVLARLVAALENISPRHASRKFSRKTESSGHQGNVDITEEVDQTHPSPALDRACSDSLSGASPYLVIGTNAVTKALEFQLRLARKHVVVDSDQLPSRPAPSPIVVVFVCCADVDPTALIDHIPYLVAGCNSSRNATQPIKLVPLPTGSEPTISRILGVRRAAVVAYRVGDRNCNQGVPLLMPAQFHSVNLHYSKQSWTPWTPFPLLAPLGSAPRTSRTPHNLCRRISSSSVQLLQKT
jgi:ribonuclease P/MRP protein subunit POP3